MKANGNLPEGTRVIVKPGQDSSQYNNFLKEGYLYTVHRTIHNGQFIQVIGCDKDWTADRFEVFMREESFIAGDLVECKLGTGSVLREGQQYIVVKTSGSKKGYLSIDSNDGPNNGWNFERFILIKPYMPENLTAVNNVEETYPIRVHFIREAHKEACEDWKARIEKECPSLFKKYPFGTRFAIATTTGDDEFLLVKINLGGRYPYASVVSLSKGTSPYKNLEVKTDAKEVAESDFLQMVGNAYITGFTIPVKS